MSADSKRSIISFAAIGECMIEMGKQSSSLFSMNFAGDTLNTALYCRRCSDPLSLSVDYITALGNDPFSYDMINEWIKEGIQVTWIRQFPHEKPGLYIIINDDVGERYFYYYRSQAAARRLFEGTLGDALCENLLDFDVLYFSSISLAILLEAGREKMIQLIQKAHQRGITICFDTNYRKRLWHTQEEAYSVITQILPYLDIALVSFEEEQKLFGDNTPKVTAERYHQSGVQEVVVKQGEKGYLISDASSNADALHYAVDDPVPVSQVVDTTGAGDAFNGAYLAGRLQGVSAEEAAKHAAELSMEVIQHKGALIPLRSMPKYWKLCV